MLYIDEMSKKYTYLNVTYPSSACSDKILLGYDGLKHDISVPYLEYDITRHLGSYKDTVTSVRIFAENYVLKYGLRLKWLTKLPKLSSLTLYNITVDEFDSLISSLHSLTYVGVEYCHVKEIERPSSTSLRTLYLCEASLSNVDNIDMSRLPNLENLTITSCRPRDCHLERTDLEDRHNLLRSLSYCTALTSLWIADTNLRRIPLNDADFSNCTRLEGLHIFGCNLSGYIPDSIGSLKELKRLSLADNELHGQIPKSIADLTKLTKLRLYNTSLIGDLSMFSSLTRLTVLMLQDNENIVGDLTKLIYGLPSLTKVYIYNTGIDPVQLLQEPLSEQLSDFRMDFSKILGVSDYYRLGRVCNGCVRLFTPASRDIDGTPCLQS